MTDKQRDELKALTDVGIERGYIPNDEQFNKIVNFAAMMLKSTFNLKKGIPPLVLVCFHASALETQIAKQLFCEAKGMSLDELEEKLIENDGIFMPINPMLPTDEEMNNRHEWLFEAGRNCPDFPNVIVMVSEVWSVKLPADKEDWDQEDWDFSEHKIRASEHSRRSELAMVAAMTIDQRSLVKMHPIDRTPEGDMVIGPEIIEKKSHTLHSPLLECFWKGYAVQVVSKCKTATDEETQ